MSSECNECFEHTLDCSCNRCDMDRKSSPKEQVNHPSHYLGKSFEVIDIIEDYELNFNLGNAVKYLLRAGKKGNRITDLQKAIWYIQREVDDGI